MTIGQQIMVGRVTPCAPLATLLLSFLFLALGHPIFAQPFTHPGCLNTQVDFDRMKAKVLAGAHPWIDSWNILVANSHSSSNYVPSPTALIVRGTGNSACSTENYSHAYNDAAAAYQLALRWKISGDVNYANAATNVLNQWSSICTNLCGDSNAQLAAGLYGYEFACAAEIMRSYSGWTPADLAQFQGFMLNVFYPVNHDFLVRHNNTCNTHYWANWDLCNLDSILAIGVFCDSRAIYNEAINYFKTGIGNGAASRVVFYLHPGYMGQWQEAGRDQGHATLGPALLGPFCEIAWNQGDDIYGYNTNEFLAGSEYVAKYNVQPLLNTVPYVGFCDCETDIQNDISSASQGTVRPGWDMVFNHYVNRKGLSATYTAQMAAQVRPEGGGGNYGGNSGGYDQLGFTTLTHTLDPIATNAIPAPSGLKPEVRNNAVTLSWWGVTYASSYNVKRATASGGPYTTIASGLGTNLYYTDVGLLPGTNYFYVVSAVVGGVEGSNSIPVSAIADSRLTGTIIGSSGSYNNLGATITNVYDNALGNFYDAANGSGDWAGLDLGVGNVITQVRYSPRAYFGGRMVGGQFQGANVANFSSDVVTLFTVAATPPEATLTSQVITNANAFRYVRYLGPANGSCNVGEVQFYGYPSPATAPLAPAGLTARPGNARVSLTWNAPAGTASFKVKRSTVSGGPYATIATGITTTSYLDLQAANFITYYYVVSAVNATGESANSAEVTATPFTTALVCRLKFDEISGTNALDSTGNGWDGTLVNSPAWVAGYSNNAVNLSSNSSQCVFLPAGVCSDLADFSITAWVKQTSVSTWSRVFDFGNNTTTYMFLTPKNGANNFIRFAITTGSTAGEQKIDGTATLPANVWKHVAVTLNGSVGILYVDGVPVGTNSTMTLKPSSLGSTALNYIGKSQWADPYLNGLVDEFRIYNGALNAGEVATFLTPLTAPGSLTATPGDSLVALKWNSAARATGYKLLRSLTDGGPYTFVTSVTATNCTDTGLVNGTAYYYVVTTLNAVGESSSSVQIAARPVSSSPPLITLTSDANALLFSWPQDHTGWRLLAQTNPPATGLTTNWFPIPGSSATDQIAIPLGPTNGSVFYRLTYP